LKTILPVSLKEEKKLRSYGYQNDRALKDQMDLICFGQKLKEKA